MIKIMLVILAMLCMSEEIPSIEIGATVYKAPPGKSLACNGHRYNTNNEWVSLPTEWFLSGLVDCGDLVYTCLPNGH